MDRTVKKLDANTFEFSTPRMPRIEKHTMQEMLDHVRMCADDITNQIAEKTKWEEKISEAEALDA